jgi:hypothetical protein
VRPKGSPTKAPWRLRYLSSHRIVICLEHGFGATLQGEGGRVGTRSASHRCAPRASPSSPSSPAWLSLPADCNHEKEALSVSLRTVEKHQARVHRTVDQAVVAATPSARGGHLSRLHAIAFLHSSLPPLRRSGRRSESRATACRQPPALPLSPSSRSSLRPAGERLCGYDNCLQSTTNLKSLGGFGSWASSIARHGWRRTGWDV